MTAVKKVQVTFDCAEPDRVARFWGEVLGYVVQEDDGTAYAAMDPDGVGPRLHFQQVPEGTRGLSIPLPA